jgi:hypothetical protein
MRRVILDPRLRGGDRLGLIPLGTPRLAWQRQAQLADGFASFAIGKAFGLAAATPEQQLDIFLDNTAISIVTCDSYMGHLYGHVTRCIRSLILARSMCVTDSTIDGRRPILARVTSSVDAY